MPKGPEMRATGPVWRVRGQPSTLGTRIASAPRGPGASRPLVDPGDEALGSSLVCVVPGMDIRQPSFLATRLSGEQKEQETSRRDREDRACDQSPADCSEDESAVDRVADPSVGAGFDERRPGDWSRERAQAGSEVPHASRGHATTDNDRHDPHDGDDPSPRSKGPATGKVTQARDCDDRKQDELGDDPTLATPWLGRPLRWATSRLRSMATGSECLAQSLSFAPFAQSGYLAARSRRARPSS